MTYQAPGLREHLEHKGRAMRQAALDAPAAEDWEERISATCVADDYTGVRKLSVRDWMFIGDGGPAIGGNDLGPTSPELLCGVISTCLTHTVLCLAAMREIPLDKVEVKVSATNNDANFFGVPSEFGWTPRDLLVDVDIVADGVDDSVVATLVSDAEQTCPVMQLLREHVSLLRLNGRRNA